jgi:hypothetical protein
MEITPELEIELKEAAQDYANAVGMAIQTEYPIVTDTQLISLNETIKHDWDLRARPWLATADAIPDLLAAIRSVIAEIGGGDVALDVTNHLDELLRQFESLTGTRPTPDELAPLP